MAAADRAYELVNGFRATQIIHALVELRIADLLAAGPRSALELSGETAIDAERLRRLLRALVALGVLTEGDDGRYANTDVGDLFRDGVPGSRRALTRMLTPESYRSWAFFMDTLRTGVTGHSLAHGEALWQHLSSDPDYAARFNAAMAGNTEDLAKFVYTAGDFERAKLVIDVGGGEGSLLAGVLLAHPGARGIVYDLAAGLVQTAAYLASQKVLDRCELVEGNFFESVPTGDVYLLKDILHDWDDEHAAEILRVCRKAMHPTSRVMVVERVMPSHVTSTPAHLNATITDLQMMVQLGGRERTVEELEELFSAAHLKLDRFTPGGVYQLIEAVAD